MLRFDMFGARAIWDRNHDRLDCSIYFDVPGGESRAPGCVRTVLGRPPRDPESEEALDPYRLERKLRKHPAAWPLR